MKILNFYYLILLLFHLEKQIKVFLHHHIDQLQLEIFSEVFSILKINIHNSFQ